MFIDLMYAPPTPDQLALEELWEDNMVIQGRDQRLAADRKQVEMGQAGATAAGRFVISNLVAPLADAIREEIARLSEGKVRRKPPELASLLLLAPTDTAALALRVTVDTLARTKGAETTLQLLGLHIGRAVASEFIARVLRKEERPLFEARVKAISERTSSPKDRTRQILKAAKQVAERGDRPEDAPGLELPDVLNHEERVRLGVCLASLMLSKGFLSETQTKLRANNTRRLLHLSEATLEALEKAGTAASMIRPTFMPTLVPPKPWTSNTNGGYWRPGRMTKMVIGRRQGAGPGALTSDAAPRMFAAVNYLQNMPFSVNSKVLRVVEQMRKRNIAEAGIPPSELIPLPPRPHNVDEDDEARKAWRTAARKVHEANQRIRMASIIVNKTIITAQDMEPQETFWFPKVIDFRGRVYDSGLYLKPQGDDLSKGLLQFANGKALGEGGGYWLAIHGANSYGVDKVPFDDRVEWVMKNEDAILAAAESPLENRFWMAADAPFQFLAFCFEWAGARLQGDDYVSRLPVAMDGSCNGLQHLSAMLRDPIGGAAVNLLPADRPSDIYTQVMLVARRELERRAGLGEPTAGLWLSVLTRSVVKRPVMTLPYGATRQGFADQIVEDTVRPLEQSGKSPFGAEGPLAAQYLSHILWAATGEVVVAARTAMDWLQAVSKVASAAGKPVEWTAPTGMKVHQEYLDTKDRDVELQTFGQRIRILLQEPIPGKIDKRRMAQAIAPNFVHSLDAAHMLRTVEYLTDRDRTDMHLSMVHDSYATHAADVDTLSMALRQAFVEMYNEKCWLTAFRDEVAEQIGPEAASELPPVPARGSLHLADVVNSLYFFA